MGVNLQIEIFLKLKVYCILIFIYVLRYKIIETHAHAFLPLNISAVGSVYGMLSWATEPDELEHFDHFYKPFTTQWCSSRV